MARSITARTGASLDRLSRLDRDCRLSTGVCTSRATVLVLFDDGTSIRGCAKHAATVGPIHGWSAARGHYITAVRAAEVLA